MSSDQISAEIILGYNFASTVKLSVIGMDRGEKTDHQTEHEALVSIRIYKQHRQKLWLSRCRSSESNLLKY